jgi:hypothetical protein
VATPLLLAVDQLTIDRRFKAQINLAAPFTAALLAFGESTMDLRSRRFFGGEGVSAAAPPPCRLPIPVTAKTRGFDFIKFHVSSSASARPPRRPETPVASPLAMRTKQYTNRVPQLWRGPWREPCLLSVPQCPRRRAYSW